MIPLKTQKDDRTAHLKFSLAGSETVVTRAFATSPVKLFTIRERHSACWVYSATFGGGLVGGDEVHLVAEVEAGARALLTTQASTKVYRSLRPVRQTVSARVDEGGLLAVIPDPIVCFAGADFTQIQRYDLQSNASLTVVDWLTSGRHAAGERWAFDRYESRIDIRRDGRRVLLDGMVLEPGLDSVACRMAHFDVILTVVLVGALVADGAARIFESTSRMPVAPEADVVVSAARLGEDGLLLRMAGLHLEDVSRALRQHLTFLSPLIGDDLWGRKW